MKKDEFDDIEKQLMGKQPTPEPEKEKTYHPSDIKSIVGELRGWWGGIQDGTLKFHTGLPLLAEYVPAYIPCHVIIISGYTSAGKSMLISQMISYSAPDTETLVISAEDQRMEKMISLISYVSGNVHRKKMLLGDVAEDMECIDKAIAQIDSCLMNIYDDAYTLDEIEMLILKHHPKIVFIDYIQNLIIPRDGIYNQMSYAAQRIYKMAQDYKVTMIIASQISNVGAREDVSEIIDLKGAGELAATAHTVIQLKKGREAGNRNKIKILIKKNKAFGNCGEIECKFNSHWTAIEKEHEYGTNEGTRFGNGDDR
jgi:predicted ATP-dependent serine protease